MRRLAIISVLLALGACTTPEQLKEQQVSACTGYGFKPGTTEMAMCMQREAGLQIQRQQAQGAAWQQVSRSLQQIDQPYSGMTTTNCNRIGQSVHCTSF